MSANVLIPPKRIDIHDSVPLLFMAGPIQGAPDWQSTATEIIDRWPLNVPQLHIANPRRPEPFTGKLSDKEYREQTDWEKSGLRRAAAHGAIIFWFARQDHSISYDKSRPYAKTTKSELQRVFGWKDHD